MILYAHLYGHKVLVTWLLTFYEQGKIHLKQLIVLLQATVLHRFAPAARLFLRPALVEQVVPPAMTDQLARLTLALRRCLVLVEKLSVHPRHHQVFLRRHHQVFLPDSPLLTFPRSPVSQKRIKLSSGSEVKVRLALMHTHMSQRKFAFLKGNFKNIVYFYENRK